MMFSLVLNCSSCLFLFVYFLAGTHFFWRGGCGVDGWGGETKAAKSGNYKMLSCENAHDFESGSKVRFTPRKFEKSELGLFQTTV